MSDAPTAWLPYVRVDSVKSTMTKAATNGARVVVAAQQERRVPALPADDECVRAVATPTGALVASEITDNFWCAIHADVGSHPNLFVG